MSMTFKKAIKSQAKLRLAIFGPAGSGKTYTALRIASGMGDNIAFIDTERGSASKYADVFSFDILELDKLNVESYVEAINLANEMNYQILIIDSLTHAWQELLEDIDKLANTKYKGNTWRAWSEGTPKQKELINALLRYKGHLIVTMRSKTEWTVEATEKGVKPTRVGLAPEQGKGIEYEFDMLMEINPEHYATVIKDRTGKFQDKIFLKPDEKFGKELINWLNSGIQIIEQKEEENKDTKIPNNLRMQIDALRMYMDLFELPENAYENLQKEIANGTLTEKRIEIYKKNCEKFPIKERYRATDKEISDFLEVASKYEITEERFNEIIQEIKSKKNTTKERLHDLKNELMKFNKRQISNPLLLDDKEEIEFNLNTNQEQEQKEDNLLAVGVY